jgi:hypothetical protein
VAPNGTITVSWKAPSNHSAKDWIGLFLVGMPAAGNTYISYRYVPAGTSGLLTFTAPNTSIGQTFDFRYLLNDGYSQAASSNAVTVSGGGVLPVSPLPPPPPPAPSPDSPPPSASPSPISNPEAGPCPNGQQIAFPGAEGFGRCTQGGRGGRVIEVTTLNDEGSGSLRQCAQEESGPRTCVFRVSGTISLGTYDIVITNPYVTIDGSTAPGGGIALKDGGISVKANHVILRYLRVRPGPASFFQRKVNANGISIQSNESEVIHDVIVDHCSVSWGTDDLIYVIYGSDNVTIQWSIFSEGLYDCGPECGGKGFLMGYGARNVSFHHNLSAHNWIRWPEVTGGGSSPGFTGKLDFVNNVQYNGNGTDTIIDPYHGPIHSNFVGNFWKDGPDTLARNTGYSAIRAMSGLTYSSSASLHVSGNIGRGRANNSFPETAIVWQDNGPFKIEPARLPYPQLTTTDAFTARDKVLAGAGAMLPTRDRVDTRVTSEVANGTGRWINDPSEVGGWPTLASTTPPVDRDRDGMPDDWETAHNLNPTDSSDGAEDADGDGYSNFEEYLHNLQSLSGGS